MMAPRDGSAELVQPHRVGTVLGRTEAEDGSSWWYVVEDALRSLGTFSEREAFYDGTALRVSSKGGLL